MTLAITTGQGLDRAIGIYTKVSPPPVAGLARMLSELPPLEEAWWSGHMWRDNKRSAKGWLASSAIVVDVDYESDVDPFPEHREAIVEMATSGDIPGNLFHLTPHGARVIFVLESPCSDRQAILSAAIAVGSMVAKAIAGSGYKVDEACHKDLARLYFTPNAKAKGIQRRADVLTMRHDPYSVPSLIADAQPPPSPTPVRRLRPEQATTFEQAAEKWVYDHPREYPRHSKECPVCGDKGSFGHLPDQPKRWHCFSTDHPSNVGIRGEQGYHGDALDLEAHERGCKPVDILRKDGYLAAPQRTAPRIESNAEPAPEPQTTAIFRPWRSRSYLTAVSILETNARDVLEGRHLEVNEMTGKVELGRKPVRDHDLHRVRGLIEARFVGGLDKQNNEVGLQLSVADVFAAAEQVAHTKTYHPVRAYLETLTWDGTPRVDHVPEDFLGVDRSPIASALLRRFFVSAVARAMKPGCKVDTMLILVGDQGHQKSTFFKLLASPAFFVDTPIDISKKDAYEQLRSAWIIEWAELESLFRARDSTAVKAFLSSCEDTYRPSYARSVVTVPRSSVIVGSTNHREFLTDETGSRRFWPLKVGMVDAYRVVDTRDQLWAEAVHLYRENEQWWLTRQEERDLEGSHDEHRVRDSWEDAILTWSEAQVNAFTTGDVLEKAIEKPRGQWSRADEMRVSRILKSAKWERSTDARDKNSAKKWRKLLGQPDIKNFGQSK